MQYNIVLAPCTHDSKYIVDSYNRNRSSKAASHGNGAGVAHGVDFNVTLAVNSNKAFSKDAPRKAALDTVLSGACLS